MTSRRRLGCVAAINGALLVACAGQVAPEAAAQQSPPPPIEAPNYLPELRELQIVRSNRPEAPSTITVEAAEIPSQPTRILDPEAAEKLFGNSGITLQWIGWEERGQTWVAVDADGHWWFTAMQQGENGQRLRLEGVVTEIGSDYFLYDGTIKISSTPDADRFCDAAKQWRFAITQNRQYWRLREFEWCDRLTDYIDIYF